MGEYVMSFMGIITNPKNESYIKKFLKEYINMEYVIFINEKNIINSIIYYIFINYYFV